MAPKSKKGGTVSEKKKKLSKIERLKQQQEEEEKRLQEEEEARLKAEQEAAERFERQQIEKRKWEALVEKDLQRRTDELEELYLLEKCFPDAEKWRKEVRVLSKWDHYVECDGTPDPSVATEINTFISLWKEKRNEDINAVMKESKLVLNLIEQLELILLDTPPHELTDEQVAQYQGSILELRELLHFKFNEATETLLKEASSLGDTDSGNMEMIIKDENVTLYVWANLKKNPKYKKIKFGDTQVGFEIPKALATSDIAFRIFHTNYDHFSPLPVIQRPEKPTTVETIIEDSAEQETPKDEEAPQAGAEEMTENQELVTSSVTTTEIKTEEPSINFTKSTTTSLKEEAEAKKEETETKPLKPESVSVGPMATLPEKSVPDAIPEAVIDEDVVDLRGFTPLGGIYHLNILQLPPQCKQVKSWTIVELISGGLQTFMYPPDIADDVSENENPYLPIEVMIEINKNVVFFEKPMVARWDSEGKGWRTDGFISLYYNMKERIMSFSVESVYPITLIQDNHIHMPYESWELRPLGLNEAVLNITTTFTDIDIQIKDNQCMLAAVELGDDYELSHLLGKWMTITSLIIAMKKTGFNIFPSEYSHAYVAVNNKDPLVEMKAYRQMALLASGFSFSWSKWNKLSGPEKVVFKASELLQKEYVEDHEWSLYMFNGERAQKLKINELSEAFSEELEDDTEFHSTLYHMIKDFTSETALQKIRHSNYLFIDAVCKLLLSTRVLTYS
ncbi:dynein axonemal intermediate chain 7 isoform X3 [Phascolarctos cinereus]|uniref:Dynein axonemal intermediate chain 7 n=1 Tax=Phascolarctos cinereus TaxID=38626 RepID=A0A6P5IEU3_PHACI|nr:protein CASC1 isoform X3 [Phascolarctos cinereus]XP_020820728.1 protein CASC1 isoform X4 [Phascolarctos cinereus]